MKFCIIGDSWGTNVKIQFNYGCLDRILIDLGHKVVNISQGGASNFGQLLYLDFQILQNNITDFDYIIWLHTEPARDFTEFIRLDYGNDSNSGKKQFPNLSFKNFVEDLDYLNYKNYVYAQELYDQYQIPFLVVGGAGKLSNSISNFKFVHWCMSSWTQKILNLENAQMLPKNFYHHHVTKMCNGGFYNRIEVLDEISKLDNLEKITKTDVIKFPDSLHPATYFYTLLLNELLDHV